MDLLTWAKNTWRRMRYYLIDLLRDKESIERRKLEEPTSPGVATPITRQPGLLCPNCNFKMPISIEMLLSGSPIICPSCSLKLNVEKEESKPVLESLRKLDNAIKKAQSSQNSSKP